MSEKPIREYDRFIVRLPDGLRERIQARAKAEGRSMNSVVITLLESALNDRGFAEVENLLQEFERASAMRKLISASLDVLNERQTAILSEIRALASGDSVGDVPDVLKEKAKAVIKAIENRLIDGQ